MIANARRPTCASCKQFPLGGWTRQSKIYPNYGGIEAPEDASLILRMGNKEMS